ncbi:hypothetical protein F5887DRAFT_620987 [Amanita rubescens]|nr:hypothetical protein F5887DRAFT_620987 [Amanita rubescens]
MSQVPAPTELLHDIIEQVWESPLTPDERVNFMTASKLVSKQYSTIFEEISSSNLHIPCESFYLWLFTKNATRDFSKCKRLTFTIYDPSYVYSTTHSSTRKVSYMQRDDITKLTSLDTICINYYNSTFPDPCLHCPFSAIPNGLSRLVISYTFSADIPSSFVAYHRRHFERRTTFCYVGHHIGILEVNGADEHVAAVWESFFPTSEKLIRDGREETKPLPRARYSAGEELLILLEVIVEGRPWVSYCLSLLGKVWKFFFYLVISYAESQSYYLF